MTQLQLDARPETCGLGTAGRTAIASGFVAASVDASVQAATESEQPWSGVVAPAAWRVLKQAAALPSRLGSRHGRRPTRPASGIVADADDDARTLRRYRRTTAPNDGGEPLRD